MNEFQKRLKEALKTIEKKRLNAFNTLIADGLKLEVAENICSEYTRAYLNDVSHVYSFKYLFQSYLYVHKEDVLVWASSKIQLMLKESEFMEGLGYVQEGYASFKRKLDDTHSIFVQRNIDMGFSNIFVKLVDFKNTSVNPYDFPTDCINHVGDIKTPVLKMEKKYMEFSSFHLMNGNLRDLLLSMA